MTVAELTSDMIKTLSRGDHLGGYSNRQLKSAISFIEKVREFHNRMGNVSEAYYLSTRLNSLIDILDHR